ncbi:ATP-binding cassette domain-containing protein [Epibacterium sp. SM1969]|uniref:ATP-binding cassette domain-containing protein n=1 Tax=Tritonibacter aquimaris TaxID=2663379 RepID=A0A844AVL1_9RHOB|nr:ABC transporter ATP-binding protein [Tritonibacter aquimaris]MQY43907.1 ATP-binding cassette domain-containing protein [Tritonibacter aquimaris]
MADIELQNLSKDFGESRALSAVSTRIEDGEFVALLGPSGCGKTTLLRLLAGFETPSSGSIRIGRDEVANARQMVPPEARNIGFVFQSYALWPHMSVRRNVSYPLEVRGLSKQARAQAVDLALETTGLLHLGDRMPSELSGGQRQRVALARCLVLNPGAVLLDEPLANLDVALRASMQMVFSDFHSRTGATMVYVTHDQSEAMAMADRIAVMSEGQIQQFDTPEMLYARPRNRFVAEFVGAGSVVPAQHLQSDKVQALGAEIAVESSCNAPNQICVRPENITLGETGDLRAKVRRATYLGGRYRIDLQSSCGTALLAESRVRLLEGAQVGITISRPWAFHEAE